LQHRFADGATFDVHHPLCITDLMLCLNVSHRSEGLLTCKCNAPTCNRLQGHRLRQWRALWPEAVCRAAAARLYPAVAPQTALTTCHQSSRGTTCVIDRVEGAAGVCFCYMLVARKAVR
jgi:hypothetical protein